jgi:hypothetical protein
MDAIKSSDACKNCEAGNSMEGGNSSRDNRKITASTAEGISATARMLDIIETNQQQY